MRLTELSPRWLAHDGNDHAVLFFRCPHCKNIWLTCTLVALDFNEQCKVLEQVWPDFENDRHNLNVVTCKKLAWSASGEPDFNRLSITPSLDASAGGHWHGHITDGAIVGGI